MRSKDTCRSLSWSKYLLKANSSLASSCKLGNVLLASNNRSLPKSVQDSSSHFCLLSNSTLQSCHLLGSSNHWVRGFLGGYVRLLGLIRQSTIFHVCLSHQFNSQPKDLIVVTPSINSRYTLKVANPIGKTSIPTKNLWRY